MSDRVLPPGFKLTPDLVVGALFERVGVANIYKCLDSSLNVEVMLSEYFPPRLAVRGEDFSVAPGPEPVVRERGAPGTAMPEQANVPLPPSPPPLYDLSATVLVRGISGGDGSQKGLFDWGLDQFMGEATALAAINHPNLPRVFRAFRHNGTAYMTTQWIDGPTLEAWARTHALTQDELDKIAEGILSALDHLHAQSLYHRDVKPLNILIDGKTGTPVLTGLASVWAQKHARLQPGYGEGDYSDKTVIISRHYAPLESYDVQSKPGPWVDIYGLAGSLYYAIACRNPPSPQQRVFSEKLDWGENAPKGRFRASFLAAIEQALSVRSAERPQTVSDWRSLLFQAGTKVKVSGQQIFISYRRRDTAIEAKAIFDALAREFGSERIFLDVDTIPISVDFRTHIAHCMDRSAVCIALVGTRWRRPRTLLERLGLSRSSGHDHVATEIELALTAKVPIIPVLIGSASMPDRASLPAAIGDFAYLNATRFTSPDALIASIKSALP